MICKIIFLSDTGLCAISHGTKYITGEGISIMDETTDNRMDIAGYLTGLRSSKNWTIKQWEAVSGVSGQTITRILDGQTAPQFQTVAALVRSADGSLDELAGIRHEPTVIRDYTPQQHTSDLIANLRHNVQYLKEEKAKSHGDDQDRIDALEGTIKKLRHKINVMTVAIIIMAFIFGLLLMFDLLDPSYGFIYRVTGWRREGGLIRPISMNG